MAGFHRRSPHGQSDSKNGKSNPEDLSSNPNAASDRVHSKDVLRDILPSCPECASQRVWRDGTRRTSHSDVQRYLCRDCGYRFSEPRLNRSDQSERLQRIHRTDFYPCAALLYDRQVGATKPEGAKNLVTVETRQKQAAGATAHDEADIRGKLIEFLWYMKKGGYSKSTIETYSTILNRLFHSGLNLYDPETIKEYLAKQDFRQSYKHVIIASYTLFLKTQRMKWDPPLCKPTRTLPFIPTERELDDLISASGKKTATFLQLLKETAMRVGEASKLRWVDVDLQRKTVILNNPEKSGKPRIFNLSNKLVTMLALLPKRTEYLFGTGSKKSRNGVYYAARKRIAHKLGNPRLQRIGFHTFRHWKATMLYHETRDPLLVKEFLGHRSLDTTLLYIQLEKALFDSTADEFTVRATSDPQEIQALLEVGFEYVCDKDGLMFFKKRK